MMPSLEKVLMPRRVPMRAPTITATMKRGNWAGRLEIELKLPNKPETELAKINTEAVPEALLTAVHPNASMSGDKKMPPPVPVMPEMKPIPEPVSTETHSGG